MFRKVLSLAALASLAAAQGAQNLTDVLGSNPSLSNLTTYLGLYPNIVSSLAQLTNVTLLAPNNEAFSKLLSGPGAASFQPNNTALISALFSYHVLLGAYPASAITNTSAFIPTALKDPTYDNVQPGQVVEAVRSGKNATFISGLLTVSNVVQADLNYTGGIVHVIDNFLTIPQNLTTSLFELNLTAADGALASVASVGGSLPETFTAFIPNNDAFQAIGSALANISAKDLAGILAYHVVPGVVDYSTLLSNGAQLNSTVNEPLTISIKNGIVSVNNAKVVIPDVLIKEGVIHVIDEVLNPAAPNATVGPAFSGASSASNVPFTSVLPPVSSAVNTASATSRAASSAHSTGGAQAPMKTGAVGAAALFGGAAAVMMNM